ncbi:MAG TPA: histidine--tRNA ligase [Actinomycetota bacterium]|nr:histidine--tRNA ligase [Actinomycetota bacterium]
MSTDPNLFRAPKGTRDILPPESWLWDSIARLGMDAFARAGYAPVETPAFEHTEVFERGVGETSEVVNKQMYTFTDLGDRSLTLRPEGTAPVVRAVLEHNLDRGPLPIKLAYVGPMFRQERPQKGRYRQFSQLGIEAIGSDQPFVDAEVIEVGKRFLANAGVESTLLLNSIGHVDPSCRGNYLDTLRKWLEAHAGELGEEDRTRSQSNPLRTFDSKNKQTQAAMKDAPLITDHLCDACRTHFDVVRETLDGLGVAYTLEPRLVRGLDYYTRTAFEYVAGDLGAQNAVGGGGRYDGLSESLGGPPLPGIGFALGLDRIILARSDDATPVVGPVRVYAVALGEEAQKEALKLVTRLRAAGVGADLDLAGRGMKGQMKDADRSGARWALILGAEELASGTATLKDLASGEQRSIPIDSIEEGVRS